MATLPPTETPATPTSRARARPAAWATLALLGAAVTCAGLWFPGWHDGPRTVRIGYRDRPPLYYGRPGTPPSGVAVEVLAEAARRRGLTVAWTNIEIASPEAFARGVIDIWPTFPLQGSSEGIVITKPWLQSSFLAISRADSAAGGPGFAGRRVASIPSPFPTDIFVEALRGATRVPAENTADALDALCRGDADTAFLEGRSFQSLLLDRPASCAGIALAFGPQPVAVMEYGIGSTPAAAPVAEALRTEILRMGEDGTLARIHSKWALGTSNETRLVYAIADSRRRERWAVAGIAALTVAFLVSLWQLARSRAARILAERASMAMADYARQQERYRLLFERNMAGVVRSTVGGRILDCNPAFARMMGYASPEELVSVPAWRLYRAPEQRTAILDRVAREGAISNLENAIVRKDGSFGCLIESVTRIDEPGGEPVLEWTAIDVTKQRQLEEHVRQAQKLEGAGRLAAGIAHDFNNLLVAINGHTELALEDVPQGSPARQCLDEIRQAGMRAASLTRQLLAFGRNQLLQPVVLNMNDIVLEVGSLLKRIVGSHISVEIRPATDLGLVLADHGQMHQVVMNLVVNARDAMPGEGRLVVETANVDASNAGGPGHGLEPLAGPCVRLRVSDTGHGMDADTMGRIFEPFFTTKAPGKGTGLGLSTAYGIVKQSGGYINVDSRPGQGTTFDVYLPRVTDAARLGAANDLPATGAEHH